MFPLGKTGGLIEAWTSEIGTGRWRSACFRWVKPAASLKHLDAQHIRHEGQVFPLGKTGGLIEA